MGAAFTPGPWLSVDGILPPDDEGNARSFVRPEHSDGWQIAQTCGPNGAANARLIAAAPELYEALRSLVGHDLTYEGDRILIQEASHADAIACVRKARAAISKANGDA